MKSISIVIPVYNEEVFIGRLLESIHAIDYPREHYEVIVVSDGSTDNTAEIVGSFGEVRLIELPHNQGRYQARKTGAEAARHPYILFIDARSVVDPGILAALDESQEKVIIGRPGGVEKPGPFETFYVAIRRLLFPQFFKKTTGTVRIDTKNFDGLPKGTTVLFVEKDVLFQTYASLSQLDMGKDSSDDTLLLRKIIEVSPGVIHPGVRTINYARQDFGGSIRHLFRRGPKFVDYYLNPRLRNFWLVIVLPLVAGLALITSLVLLPADLWIKLAVLLGVDVFFTVILSRSLREFAVILYMLPLCAAVFYAGILYGIWLKFKQRS